MVVKKYCLDTYALVEIYRGNQKFSSFLLEDAVIASITLAEFYGVLYREEGRARADFWFKKLSFLARPVSQETLIAAVRFRLDHKSKNLSFFDCVGYLFSQEHHALFVTGDKEFEHLEGVAFVKK